MVVPQRPDASRRDSDPDDDGASDAPIDYDPLAAAPPPPPIPELLTKPVHDPRPKAEPKSGMASVAEMGRAWATALDFVFTILGGAGLGWLFDYWRKTGTKGLLTGLVLGFIIATIRIIRATQAQERAEKARRDAERGQG